MILLQYNDSGRIHGVVSVDPSVYDQAACADLGWVEFPYAPADTSTNTHFVDTRVHPPRVGVREELPATLAGAMLSQVPCPCSIEVSGPVQAQFYCESWPAVLAFDVPGTYAVRLEPSDPRWLPKRLEATA